MTHGEQLNPLRILVETATTLAASLLLLELFGFVHLGWTEFQRHLTEGTLHVEKVWIGVGTILLWLSNKWAPVVEAITIAGSSVVLLWQQVFRIIRLCVATVIVTSVIALVGYATISVIPKSTEVSPPPPSSPIPIPQPPMEPPSVSCPQGQRVEDNRCVLIPCGSGFVRSTNGQCVRAPVVRKKEEIPPAANNKLPPTVPQWMPAPPSRLTKTPAPPSPQEPSVMNGTIRLHDIGN
jgi:hypothetical protein